MSQLIPSLEDVIKSFLNSASYRPMTRHELAEALHVPLLRRRELRAALRRLHSTGEVVLLRKNRWASPDTAKTVTGRLSIHAWGHGTIGDPSRSNLRIRIESDALHNAIHGDLVEVMLLPKERYRRARSLPSSFHENGSESPARVIRVLERGHPVLCGILKRTDYYWYLIPFFSRFPQSVRVRDTSPGVNRRDGHLVSVRLDAWDPHAPLLSGCMIEDMGPPDAPGVDMLALMRQYGLDGAPSRDAAEEAMSASPAIHASALKGRVDLRRSLSITIDPVDAKDFDDAVSLSRLANGAWLLDVHIADVAHHVRQGGAIDKDALSRGTSVYLVDRTIPMLPMDLTSDVCSLLPDTDRLCHTVRMTVDASGRLMDESTFRSVIRSRHRMDYESVQSALDGSDIPSVPADLRPTLRDMRDLASVLRRQRIRSGAIGFTLPEVKVEMDDEGRIRKILRRGSAEAYGLIEEFMLLANRTVARRMSVARVPALYRIHDPPDEDQWADMAVAVNRLGVRTFNPDPNGIRTLMESIEQTPLAGPVATAILRHFTRAEYSPRCGVHFGLAFKPYTHFTSPIRRYPDLVVHRILCALENGEAPPYDHGEIARIAVHASGMEKSADEAERDSLAIKRIQYYRSLLLQGKTGPYPVLVTGRTARGFLIEVVDTLQRGLIPSHFLSGRRPNDLRPGCILNAEILQVDMHRKWVDFRPASAESVDDKRRQTPGGPRMRRHRIR